MNWPGWVTLMLLSWHLEWCPIFELIYMGNLYIVHSLGPAAKSVCFESQAQRDRPQVAGCLWAQIGGKQRLLNISRGISAITWKVDTWSGLYYGILDYNVSTPDQSALFKWPLVPGKWWSNNELVVIILWFHMWLSWPLWGHNKMVNILQMKFAKTFSWKTIFVSRLKWH